jgi:putative Ca2+/H+ antiporter (TMEM165/GDT1 family)
MDAKIFTTVLAAVFLAELGDKTQLATLLFAADNATHKLTVFMAASVALILTTAIGVVVGGVLPQFVSEKSLHLVAGLGFIGIGMWILLRSFASA